MQADDLEHPGFAWFRWCSEHAAELPLPISKTWWEGNVAVVSFDGANPNIQFHLSRDSLSTSVHWSGQCVDILFDAEACPELQPDGTWQCSLCEPRLRISHATQDSLLRAELFDLWLLHTRELLLPDVWVFIGRQGGSSWAHIRHTSRPLETLRSGHYSHGFRSLGGTSMSVKEMKSSSFSNKNLPI